MKFISCKMAAIRYKFAPKFAAAYLGVSAPYSQVPKFISLPGDRLFWRTLTFRGPCIVIYSYNKSQRDALLLKFILIKKSTCFGQIYRTVFWNKLLVLVHDKYLLLCIHCWDSWWWTVDLSETCRVLYHNKFETKCISLAFIIRFWRTF